VSVVHGIAPVQAETQPIEGAPEPETLSYAWPARAHYMNAEPPPPELRKFVRSLCMLGVPMHEISRRVKERCKVKNYSTRSLYRDFADDLIPRTTRSPRGVIRMRLIEKPQGWKPIIKGSPFSYADLLGILQSDLDSRDLGRLYGVKDELIYKIRRGESKYTKYVLPRMTIAPSVEPKDMAFRAMVTADMAVHLVTQMKNLIERVFALIENGNIADPMAFDTPWPKTNKPSKMFYRKKENGDIEQREVFTTFERRTARLQGWTKEKPA
jgi:hypothetical protein